MEWAIWVLRTSSLLNAAYFLPILYRVWFRVAPGDILLVQESWATIPSPSTVHLNT